MAPRVERKPPSSRRVTGEILSRSMIAPRLTARAPALAVAALACGHPTSVPFCGSCAERPDVAAFAKLLRPTRRQSALSAQCRKTRSAAAIKRKKPQRRAAISHACGSSTRPFRRRFQSGERQCKNATDRSRAVRFVGRSPRPAHYRGWLPAFRSRTPTSRRRPPRWTTRPTGARRPASASPARTPRLRFITIAPTRTPFGVGAEDHGGTGGRCTAGSRAPASRDTRRRDLVRRRRVGHAVSRDCGDRPSASLRYACETRW